LRCGFALRDATPGRSVSLGGYDFRQEHQPPGNDGVLDPLGVRALALDTGGEPAVLVSADQLLISSAHGRRLRAVIAEGAGIGRERVHVACTHTHSGPLLIEEDLGELWTQIMPHSATLDEGPQRAYAAAFDAAILDAAAAALADRAPVDLRVREAPLGLAYDRRVPLPDGGVDYCWNRDTRADLDPRSSPDQTLTCFAFAWRERPGGVALWSHGAHPVTLGKESRVVSADWPGAAARCLATERPGWAASFVLGPCGETHPWLATQSDPAALDRIGRPAGSLLALLVEEGGVDDPDPGLACVAEEVVIDGTALELGAWRIGPAVLATAPVECFAALAPLLRRRHRAPLLLGTNVDGWTGYWAPGTAWKQGGYEVAIARACGRSPGDGEALVDAWSRIVARACDAGGRSGSRL